MNHRFRPMTNYQLSTTMINDQPSISIFTTDTALVVRSGDKRLAKITGLPENTVRGNTLDQLVPSFQESGIWEHFERVLQQGIIETIPQTIHPYLFPCPPTHSDSHFSQMQQRVTIAPLKENGVIVGTVVTIEDITPQLDLTLDLDEQLKSLDENLRLQAVQTLSNGQVLNGEKMLVKALADTSWRVRRAAVDGLAAISRSSLATSLLRSLREEHRNPSVLNGILQVLAHSRVDIVPALIDCLNSEDPDLRIYAALALGEQKDLRAIPALLHSLNDADLNVKYHVIDALGHLQAIEAVEDLVSIACGGDFFLAFPALDALKNISLGQDNSILRRPRSNGYGGNWNLPSFPGESLGTREQGEEKNSLPPFPKTNPSSSQYQLPKDDYQLFNIPGSSSAYSLSTVAPRLLHLLFDELLCAATVDALGFLGDARVVQPIASLLNRPGAPVSTIAVTIGVLYDRYENASQEGDYIIDLACAVIEQDGIKNLLISIDSRGEFSKNLLFPTDYLTTKPAPTGELKPIVLLLGRMFNPEAAMALIHLLGEQTVRSSVIEALVRYGKQVTQLLIEHLQADDLEVRRAAVMALGRIGDPGAVLALTQLLTVDPELMVVTANALAQIGDRRAFDTLLSLIGHPDAAVRLAVIAALNSLGHPDMLNHMIDLLQDKDPKVRESAVKIAGYFAFNECVTLLLERCHDPDEDVRRAAIELIPYLENAPVLPTIIAALEQETPKVRAAAARALGQMDSSLAYPYLLNAMKDRDAWVRYYAARAIGWNGYTEAADVLAVSAQADSAIVVRIATVEALGRIGGTKAVSILAPIVKDLDAPNDLVRAALTALGKIGHPNSLPPLLATLRSQDAFRRIHAARALGKRGGTGVEAMLQDLAATETEGKVVIAAIEALADLATPEAIAALLELTANPIHNEACILALANLGEEQVEAIGRGLSHFNLEVRCATVDVLTRLRCPRASFLLITALDNQSQPVRLAAVHGLEHLGNRDAERKFAVMAYTDPDSIVRRAAQKAIG